VLLAILAGIVWLIIPNVADSMQDLQANGMTYITRLIDSINAVIAKLPLSQGEESDGFLSLEKLLSMTIDLLSTSGSWLVSNIASIAGGAVTVLKNIVVGIFISIYVVLSKERLNPGRRRVIHALFTDKHEKKILYYCGKAHNKFARSDFKRRYCKHGKL
jgi:predicted PurR-regulated permease PerM